jgi:MFS family permease
MVGFAGGVMNDELQRRTIRTITLKLMPLLLLGYLIAYIDRINIGFAATALKAEFGISNAVFGLGAGLFFIGYFLFEVPSNLLLEKFGPRRWIARIMVTWGILSTCMIFVRGENSFYVLRFLLGFAEAGFYPGAIYYIVCWYPSQYRARMMAAFSVAIPLATVLGSPLSSALLGMNGVLGMPGWHWMFILEGLPAVLIGILFFFKLPDRPRDAKWLKPDERTWLEATLAAEPSVPQKSHALTTLKSFYDPRVLVLCAVYFANTTANLGIGFFLPQIIASMGTTRMETGYLTALPSLVGIFGLIFFGWVSDRFDARRGTLLATLLVTFAGLFLAAYLGKGGASAIGIAALSLAAIGIQGLKAPFWALTPLMLASSAAAGGIAWINSVGNLGGFFGPSIIGFLTDRFGGYQAGIYALAATQIVAAVLVLLVLKPRSGHVSKNA